MKKKTLASLFLTLSLTVSTSLEGTILVQANGVLVDQLYTNAYNAIQTVISTGKQADINNARNAIGALKGTGASWAIGEFSKEVDNVQQSILVNIIKSINTAKSNPSQANINIAKVNIPNELTPEWKNSYSSAIDEIEQGLISDATNAYNTALNSKTSIDITNAENKINDIMTSTDSNVVKWIKDYKTKLDILATANEVTITTPTTTNTTTSLTYFPKLSYVPQPTGVNYDKEVVSGNTIMYEYSVLNVPLNFMNTYKNELSNNGWGNCSTTYADADSKIPYYSYINNGYELSICKLTSDFYVIAITPTGTNAANTTASLTYFPKLSYVPQPTGVNYDREVVSGNTIMYEYSVLNVPLNFMNTYKNELSNNGWGNCSTAYADADSAIPYYSYINNGYELSICKLTSDFYVITITPTGANAANTTRVVTKQL